MVDLAIKLTIYNEALSDFLGERILNSLSESRKPRRVLDAIWNAGAMDYCLERADWNWAIRSVQADASPSIDPDFGFRYGFDKPDDWLRTSAVSLDEYFKSPLLNYSDENGYWYADVDQIYIRYVSKDDNYGYDMSKWTQAFRKYVASYLAFKAGKSIMGTMSDSGGLEMQMKKALYAAKSHDALGQPPSFQPTGSWVKSRTGSPSRMNRGAGGYTGY
jgi:hypothetical protein